MNAAEQDLRGETALCLMALLTWAEFHGGLTPLIDGTVERFITAGKPHDAGISRAITNTRRALARYLEHGGTTPAWLPASVLTLLKASSTDVASAELATASPSRTRTTTTCQRSHSVAKVPEKQPTRKEYP